MGGFLVLPIVKALLQSKLLKEQSYILEERHQIILCNLGQDARYKLLVFLILHLTSLFYHDVLKVIMEKVFNFFLKNLPFLIQSDNLLTDFLASVPEHLL